MRKIPIYFFLFLLITCAKEDSEIPGTPPSQIIRQYTLTANASDGGSVSGGGTFASGTQVSLTATPNAGYSFSGWSNGSTANPVTVTLNSNTTITANFQVIVNSYTLTVTAGEGGTVTGGGEYEEGTEVTITATAEEGYTFVNWSNGSTESSISISVSENINLEATFEELPKYQVTLNDPEGGEISASSGSILISSGEFYQGFVITLIAIPDDGYRFKQWIGIDNSSNQIEISIDSEIEISAEFEPIPFDVNDMDNVKYPLYNKDTLSGKKVDTKQLNFYYFTDEGLDIRDVDLESSLDFLASESFIVYWDKRHDHTNYAIDILRWSEFAAIKAIEIGMPKPKDFDTHRINIFIARDDEYGEDIFPDVCQCAHTASNGRRWLSFPWYENFIEGSTELNNFPWMNVAHEIFHTFQKNNRSWLGESTADYFESKFFADLRYGQLRFIPDFLKSTHYKLWSDYSTDIKDNQGLDIGHIYGKELLWKYLVSYGHITDNFFGTMNQALISDDNYKVNNVAYLLDNISNFRDKYFDFSMKATVIDFPDWKDKIIEMSNVDRIKDIGKRHELTLKSNLNQVTKENDEYNYNDEYITPSVNIGPWGFSSYKILSESNNSYKIEIETEYLNYRLGLVINRGGEFQYFEFNSGDVLNFQTSDVIYIVISDIPETNVNHDAYGIDNSEPYKIKFTFQE